MHGQAREPRQDRKVATVTTSYQCRGVPGHYFYRLDGPDGGRTENNETRAGFFL